MPKPDNGRGAIAWMTRHGVAPNLLMGFMLIGGFFLATQIKQEVFPEFSLDMVTITVPYPGASPEEVEQGIVLAIEESVRGVTGVKEITAVAHEGGCTVIAELEENSDEQRIYQEIQQEINSIRTMPEEAEEPDVVLSVVKREVMDVILYGDADEWVLRELAEQVRDRLLQNEGITQITMEPERTFEISIEIPQETLRAHNLTLGEVADRIRSASVDLPGGSVKTEAGEILLRMKERRDWAKEFNEIPIITAADGTQLLVRHLGEVKDTFEESYEFLTYNGKHAVTLEVYRVGDQTPIGVSDAVRDEIEDIRASLPGGIAVDIPRDMSDIYRQRLELLLRNGFMGLVLVFVILTVFLEHKLAFWVTMGIPVSFLGSFLFLPGMDVTINMISMFAFIIALGIVVDDAIVVGENIFEYRQQGMSLLNAAIQGARDVAVPVTFSILTNIAAFAPLAFVPGHMGKVFQLIPLVVSSVFMISLLESLFVLPAHLSHTKRDNATMVGRFVHGTQEKLSVFISRRIETWFGPLLRFALRFRYVTASLAVVILMFVIAYVQSGRLGFVLMPKVEADNADATAVLPYGAPLSRLYEVRDQLVTSAQAVLAENGGEELARGVRARIRQNEVEVRAYLQPPEIRPVSTSQVSQMWRELTGEIEGLESLRFESDRGGPGSGAGLTVELAHTRIDVLDRASAELAAMIEQFPNVKDVNDGYTPGKQQLDFKMLPEGRSLGLTAGDVARQLRGSFYGAEALRQQRGRNEIKVMVRLPKENRISEHDIESLIVRTPGGIDVPLRQVATVQRGRAYTTINRRDGRRTVSVTADVVPQSETEQVLTMVQAEMLPELAARYPGLSFSFEGKQSDMRESMQSLGKGFIVALLMIYVLLGIPFRSYFQPMIVMVSIPFGIVGAVIGHMIMGYSLSVISLMGVIALSGVVVNDALVLIDYANRQRLAGMGPFEAIHSAGIRRFRPILLTTLTTFGGLAPMIFETSRQARFMIPMAISLGYGIMFATAITLLLIPCLYLILEDVRNLAGLRRAVPTPEAAFPAVVAD